MPESSADNSSIHIQFESKILILDSDLLITMFKIGEVNKVDREENGTKTN